MLNLNSFPFIKYCMLALSLNTVKNMVFLLSFVCVYEYACEGIISLMNLKGFLHA